MKFLNGVLLGELNDWIRAVDLEVLLLQDYLRLSRINL